MLLAIPISMHGEQALSPLGHLAWPKTLLVPQRADLRPGKAVLDVFCSFVKRKYC